MYCYTNRRHKEVFCLSNGRLLRFWLAVISIWLPVALGQGGCSSPGPPARCMWSVGGCCCGFHCLLSLLRSLLRIVLLLRKQQWHTVADCERCITGFLHNNYTALLYWVWHYPLQVLGREVANLRIHLQRKKAHSVYFTWLYKKWVSDEKHECVALMSYMKYEVTTL